MSDDVTARPTAPWSTGTLPPVASPLPGRSLIEPIADTTATRLLLTAVAGGFVAQTLFVGQALGINVPIWSTLVLVAAVLVRRGTAQLDRADAWLPPAALVFAAFVAIRGDPALLFLNTLASWTLLAASVAALRGVAITRGTWSALVVSATAVAAAVVGGATRLTAGLRPLSGRIARDSPAARVLVGLLLALPLVLVFSALFAAADAVFAAHLGRLLAFDVSLDELVGRTFFAFVAGWLLAGLLLVRWLSDDAVGPRQGVAMRRRLGVIEASIVLLAVDAVFSAFMVLQAAYLFGGLDTLAVSGMTYSEYARRGFFELIAVAVLAGLVILAVDSTLERRSALPRVAAGVLAVLTGVVLVSAVVRLSLYQGAYGWTELRFYALLAIAWLGLGVVSALGGLALDRVRLVPRVLVVGALLLAIAANVVGPQRFVTEQNLARATDPSLVPPDGRSGLDVNYLWSLGDEAVPLLVAAAPQLPVELRTRVEFALRDQADYLRYRAEDEGWQSFNLARSRALQSLAGAGY
jgi:hypothetical protein